MSQTAEEARLLIRKGKWPKPTSGLAPGFTQANLVILPQKYAYDFLLFTNRNPKSCPLIEVTDIGSPYPNSSPTADLRTDLPKYKIFENGKFIEEREAITSLWSDDLVSFLIGCSFTFERPLLESGIPIRHLEEEKNTAMYITNIPSEPAGIFQGPMVVSMRPMSPEDALRAVQITSRFPSVHGAPIHIGDPEHIGIKNIDQPDFGDQVTIKEGEVPVFWACGVTPQIAIEYAKPHFVITHSPGHMFITDLKESDHSIL